MSEWTDLDRARYRHAMARRESPLAILPNGDPVWGSELDLRGREAVRVVVGYLLVAALVIAVIVAPLAIGGLLISALGL